jgi:hypothetical protein
VNDYLGVAVGVKLVPTGFKFRTQLREIIDFTVEDQPRSLILVVDWLVACGKIDDAQSTHAQSRAIANIDSFVVGPSMDDRLAHAMNVASVGWTTLKVDETCYSAHRKKPLAISKTSERIVLFVAQGTTKGQRR